MMQVMSKEVVLEQPQVWQPDGVSIESTNGIGLYKPLNVKDDGISEKSEFLENSGGEDLRLEDINIPRLLDSIIRNQNGSVKDGIVSALNGPRAIEGDVIGTSVMVNKELRIDLVEKVNREVLIDRVEEINKELRLDLVEDSDEEVIELEFERAVEKFHTHTPYCPNCSSLITKVILRRRKQEDRAPSAAVDGHHSDKTLDLFGCLSCFSIFVPSGNVLNPFRIFGTKGKHQSSKIVDGEHVSGADHATAPRGLSDADGSATIKQGKGFGLFWIFRKWRDGESAEDAKGKCTEESNAEEENSFDNSSGAPPVSGVQVPLLHGYRVSGYRASGSMVKDENIGSSGSQKPGHYTQIIPPDASVPIEDLAISIGDESVGTGTDSSSSEPPEILKCIVYGGLMELITSLSVVSSAAASDTSALNVIALALATLISGLIVFGHNLAALKKDTLVQNSDHHIDRYQELLGKRDHFLLHSTLAILSFLALGLIPPIVYGFTFRESDNKEYKILAVAAASFACMVILAAAQAYVRKTPTLRGYVKTIMYYLTTTFAVSGVAYATGHLVKVLMERLGWFGPAAADSY